MEKFIWIIIVFVFMNLIISILKVLWTKFSKCTFSYWEVLLDIITLIIICTVSWLAIQLYIYIDIDTLLTKLISGLLFFVVIPYVLVLIRKNIYSKLKYELALNNDTLYIGYFYILIILAWLIGKFLYLWLGGSI